ncbi:hypothetical protein G15_2056 [Enterococcus avium]|uniref:hypothetical protein n=1 Tax=Enterococcus malodoratus TaxID=71451 RepID=UPI001599FCD0|nr:hypothetical protein G15_2056 [Enterococcus avium]
MISEKLLVNEILKLDSRKNIDKLRLTMYGLLTSLILSKDLFPHNPDLRPFIDSIGLNYLKDYLFKNRTALLAKVSREIENMNDEQLKNLTIKLKTLFKGEVKTNNNNSDLNDIISRFSR